MCATHCEENRKLASLTPSGSSFYDRVVRSQRSSELTNLLDEVRMNHQTATKQPFILNKPLCFQDTFLPTSLCITIVVLIFSASAFGQVAIPVPNLYPSFLKKNDQIPRITKIQDHLFVATERSLFILDRNGRAMSPTGMSGSPLGLRIFGDQVFTSTSEHSWLVRPDGQTIQVKGIDTVDFAEPIGQTLYVASGNTLFSVTSDGAALRIQNFETSIVDLVPAGDSLFVLTRPSLFQIREGQAPLRIKGVTGDWNMFPLENSALVAGDGYLCVVRTPSDCTSLKGVSGKVTYVTDIGKHVLVATTEGLFIANENNIVIRVAGIQGNPGIGSMGDKAFVSADKKYVLSEDGNLTTVNGAEGEVNTDAEVGDHLFIGTNNGVSMLAHDATAASIPEIHCSVSYLQLDGDRIFVGTPCEGIWIVNKQGAVLERMANPLGQVFRIETVADRTYILSSYGLYRLDPHVSIRGRLVPNSWWARALAFALPAGWLPADSVSATAEYVDEHGKDPYEDALPREFRFTTAPGQPMPTYDKFSPQAQFYYDLKWGKNTVHYWVKDAWENTFEQEETYRGLPAQYSFILLPFALSFVFVFGCFALAPRVYFCHSMVMNPWLRRYFSLGSIPLLLSIFPPVRRHILRRYSDSVANDKEFAEWRTRFVYPDEEFYPPNVGKRIESERRLLLIGQSGIGKTSFFKHLTAHYSLHAKATFPKRVSPVYISLTNFGGNSLEELVYTQLFSHGKITDKELAPLFLEQGGLVIFLDGVNEVRNIADRQKLSEFVERFWTSNYIFLSSQQSYPEIENVVKLELKTFTRDNIRDFIYQRVNNKETAKNIISTLTDDDYQLYGIPRDLEFGIDILNDGGGSLPKSRTVLYEKTLRTLFAKWQHDGNTSAADRLCERAFLMILHSELTFDSVETPELKEVSINLLDRKFLIRRESNYYFRHELICSYLASKYFIGRWNNLLESAKGKPIDINWLDMLKFSCENITDPAEVKALVFKVLEKSLGKKVVRDLFDWLKTTQSFKCEVWEQEFFTKYGALDFEWPQSN